VGYIARRRMGMGSTHYRVAHVERAVRETHHMEPSRYTTRRVALKSQHEKHRQRVRCARGLTDCVWGSPLPSQLASARVDMFNEALGLYKKKNYDEVR
jgi:hypothetical protein